MDILIADTVEPTAIVDDIQLSVPAGEATKPQVESSVWQQYLTELDPNSQSAAFILPHEMLSLSPLRIDILATIEQAVVRIFGRKPQITEYLCGHLQGNTRLLLPQGIEIAYSFDNELAWRVQLQLDTDQSSDPITLYFNAPTFNPLRIKADKEGVIGAMFTPVDDADDVMWVRGSAESDYLVGQAITRLQSEFEQLQK